MYILSWFDQFPLLVQMGFVIVCIVLGIGLVLFIKDWIAARKNNR